MSGMYILDGHEPVPAPDHMAWARWLEEHNADRSVARTQDGEIMVSTVFLGLDHSFGGAGGPVLFETLVFGGVLDGEGDRYRTWDEAEAGHEVMVQRVTLAESAASRRHHAD